MKHKKTLLCLLLLPLQAYAGDATPGAEGVRQVLDSSGLVELLRTSIAQGVAGKPGMPDQLRECLSSHFLPDMVTSALAPVLAQHISGHDLRVLNTFYKTKEGRHVATETAAGRLAQGDQAMANRPAVRAAMANFGSAFQAAIQNDESRLMLARATSHTMLYDCGDSLEPTLEASLENAMAPSSAAPAPAPAPQAQ